MAPVEFVMINNYLIDVSIKEDHSFTNDVTEFPVESGGSLSDNIRPKPITVTLEGIVSNSPLGEILTQRKSSVGNDVSTGQVEAAEAYLTLVEVWNGREPVTIRTSLATFENMAMTSLTIPKSKESGDALHFTAAFQQITIITNERKKIRTRTSIRNGHGKRDRGQQNCGDAGARLFVWRKGAPPGSHNVYGEEFVHYSSIGANSTSAFNVEGRNGATVTVAANRTHTYYHQDNSTPLTDGELKSYHLDMARDAKVVADAKLLKAYNETPLGKAEVLLEQQKQFQQKLLATNQDKLTKRPIANMSDQKRVTLKDGSGIDPLKKAFSGPNGSTGF